MPRNGGYRTAKSARPRSWDFVVSLAVALTFAAGCSSNLVTLRSAPNNPLADTLQLASYSGPRPSERTEQLLRVHNLTYEPKADPRPLIKQLQTFNESDPNVERVYAMAEIAYLAGMQAQRQDNKIALDLYGASVLYSYQYLFDDRYVSTRNPYDPQYRGACDLYNSALEAALRIVCANKELIPNSTKTIETASGTWDITFTLQGTQWRPEDFARFEFVSDYNVTGLKNLYQNHGLGVPLIAVRPPGNKGETPASKYYPPDLSFPVTVFMRPLSDHDAHGDNDRSHKQGVLELYDPLATGAIVVNRSLVPLESDLTTPLAYFLSKPELNALATAGLLRPDALINNLRPGRRDPVMGLYMVQPYEPGKIPVVMVHGLWSSPMTWMEMFNDLRSSPEIRDRYQFWFYLYPTGQPFWLSAANLRNDLAEVRRVVDPRCEEPALDQMVLVGHSMGGLISELQTYQSRDDYWKLVSREPLDQIKAAPEAREKLKETFFFQPNPSIRRVITLGTPHRGSTFSDQTTQWLLDKLIHLPQTLYDSQQQLFRENQDAFFAGSLIKVKTSIDSLSPASPIFPVMLSGRRPPWVKYHNIVGVVPPQWWLSYVASDGDGVVSRASAHEDGAASEIVVPADHTTVHMHPAAVLEVRRILLEHLADLRAELHTEPAEAQIDRRVESR